MNKYPVLLVWALAALRLSAQSTAFTYQGLLNDGLNPANGVYDFQFALFDSANAGNQIGSVLTNSATSVSAGLFRVTLDFGNQFPGLERWMEIGVRTNGAGAFTTLSLRQRIDSTPYAIQAANAASAASVSGSISASQLSGTISSNNIGAGSITTVMLAAGAVGSNQLAAGAVTTDSLADRAVTAAKVNFPLLLTATNPTPAAADHFGVSVAALGNDRVLIGAQNDDTGAPDTGAAYLLSTSGALLMTFTNPTPTFNDLFGLSVAAVGTDRVLIGAYQDDTFAGNAGAAYLFSTNGALVMTFTNPPPAAADNFGWSVAAFGTDRVLIGAQRDDTGATDAGAAHLFSTNGALLMTFNNPTPHAFDRFGHSLAAVGTDRILIGAPFENTAPTVGGAAYLFSTNGALVMTFTNPTPANGDLFGDSVAALGTDRVLIGADLDDTGADGAGAAYLFGTNGVLLTTFTNPAPTSGDNFGWSVTAVGTDRVLIGALGDDSGASDAGTAYLFSTNGALLMTFMNPTPTSGDNFGASLAAVGTDRVLIGAPGNFSTGEAGAAYLFSLETFIPGLIADGVDAGSITTASLADGAVTASKIGGVLSDSQIPDLNASKITSGTLADGRLSSNVALLNANNQFSGTNGLNDRDLRLRGNSDPNHGIGWHGSGKPFAGFSPDGPMLFGYAAGGLGTTVTTQKVALMWNASGRVGIGTANPASTLDVVGTVSATNFSGNGGGLTNLAAANLTGFVPAATLTSVPAANLTGTVADARLSGNVALLNGTNVFTGTNRFSGQVIGTNLNNQFAGTFTGTLYASAPYLKFAEVTANAAAGSSVAGTNNWRVFNLELTDTHNLGSTNGSGDIVLPAGTYQCRISAPAFRVETHQIRLRTSTGSNLLFGTIGYSDSSTGGSEDRSQIEGQFTLLAAATLRVQHWCTLAKAGDGLGALSSAPNWGDASQPIFAVSEYWKIK